MTSEVQANATSPSRRPARENLAAEFALVLGAFAMGTSEFASMGLLPDMARDTHTSVPVAGHLISAYAIGVVVGAPVIAAVAARASRRALVIGLLALFTIGNALTAVANHFGLLVFARFVSGLPHGAYFGVAALIAATLAHPGKRAQAVARVMMGLSIANLVGAPLGTWIGEVASWRTTYGLLAGLAIITTVLCRSTVPPMHAAHGASARRELGALTKLQVWLTLGIGAIGLGGLFSVYTYLAPALLSVTGVSASTVPPMLVVIGLGMFCGNFLGGWLADRGVMRAIGLLLLLNVATYAAFYFSFHSFPAVTVNVFFAGLAGVALVPPLQTRLMDVAGHAQSLGAMLNGCAINIANALGAALGGLAIASGFGLTSTGVIGAALAAGGLLVFLIALVSGGSRERSDVH